MTGEDPQPGGREPAPGQLALVQAFVNSHYDLEIDHGADLLASVSGLRSWLVGHQLIPARTAVSAADLDRARNIREALRSLARVGGDSTLDLLNEAAAGAALEIRFGPAGPRFVAHEPDVAGALGVLLAVVAGAMLDGNWRRLKVCPGDDCGWLFFDHSRNRSGKWCSMSVCGGREKARSHYRRKRAAR